MPIRPGWHLAVDRTGDTLEQRLDGGVEVVQVDSDEGLQRTVCGLFAEPRAGIGELCFDASEGLQINPRFAQELAELAGCSTGFVHMVEAGKATVRLDKVLDLLEVLGLELRVVRGGRGIVDALDKAAERRS